MVETTRYLSKMVDTDHDEAGEARQAGEASQQLEGRPEEDQDVRDDLIPSSALDTMLAGFSLDDRDPSSDELFEASSDELFEGIFVGTRIADRYDATAEIASHEHCTIFAAHDSLLDRRVTLSVRSADELGPEANLAVARAELALARALSHPNICRVHDLVVWRERPILIMEGTERTLRQAITGWQEDGWPGHARIRGLFNGMCEGLSYIHRRELVHGAINPDAVLLEGDEAKWLFGPATTRERLITGTQPRHHDRVDPTYFSLERLIDGHTSGADDVYALTLVLWEMLTMRPCGMGVSPRDTPLLDALAPGRAAAMSVAEMRGLFDGLSRDPILRPSARRLRMRGLHAATPVAADMPGRPPCSPGSEFAPGRHSLLITYASNAPSLVGRLYPLDQPEVVVGRHADVSIAEKTLSKAHARMRWHRGAWYVTDCSSTNGTYVDHAYEQRHDLVLRNGDHLQLGELRLRLVGFEPNSVSHWRARQRLESHDGLTGFLHESRFTQAASETARFADWAGLGTWLLRFDVRWPSRMRAPVALVAARRVSRTLEEILREAWPGCTAIGLQGVRVGHAKTMGPIIVMLAGRSSADPDDVLRRAVRAVERCLPEAAQLFAEVIPREHGEELETAFDRVRSSGPPPS